MQTSLLGISNKARSRKKYRFRNLYTMLNEQFLLSSWHSLNKNAASGVDRVSSKKYSENLEVNIGNLVSRLKSKSYRARLVRRSEIPKGNGKTRTLGIPTVEDKLLQQAVSQILQSIYEEDFIDNSFGYRPGKSAKGAISELTKDLQFNNYGFVVEADIKGFFDNLDHDWLIKMLNERVNDEAFIRLIRKWLKAGILDTDRKVIHPLTGTPQGGVVSPILANIYLHYVLDLWFEKVVKAHISGQAVIYRYADDFVCVFENKRDADRFYRTLPKRLAKFGLELSMEKTKILIFNRNRLKDNKRFDFLGFEFRWGTSRKGKRIIQRRTSRDKFRKSLLNFAQWCKQNRSLKLWRFMLKLNRKLQGYYQYYGVIGNFDSLQEFAYLTRRMLFKWLNRRSQRNSFNWSEFDRKMSYYNLCKPYISEKINFQYTFRLASC